MDLNVKHLKSRLLCTFLLRSSSIAVSLNSKNILCKVHGGKSFFVELCK